MELFQNSRPYRILAGDAASGRLAHAYLFICPDGRSLRPFLKQLALLILGADARTQRLVEEECFADCRIFPAPGQRAGVEQVKELLEDCYIKPVEGDRKLFILDNVQDMLAPAQNKLLKVLEEPPAGVYFLLGATGEYAVLPTVRSRAKRLELLSFPEEEIASYIRRRYPHRQDAAAIAALAGGALGRAEELAEGGPLGAEAEEAAQLLATLSPAVIPQAARRRTGKEEAARFVQLWRLAVRDALLYKLGRKDLLLSGADEALVARAAGRYTEGALVRALEAAARTEYELKFNANSAMSIEMLLAGILEGR